MYLLENLKSDVKIVGKKQKDTKDSFDFISTEELDNCKRISNDYKNGNRKNFVQLYL